MTQVLIDFYNKNKDKIELVINGESQSLHNHFYKQVYSRKWVDNIELQKELVTYLHQFRDSIKRSLHQLGIKHNELRHKAELKLKKSKPFLETIVKPSSEIELTDEVDKYYLADTIKEAKTEFKRTEANKNPKPNKGRDDMIGDGVISILGDYNLLESLPSTARNKYKYVELGLTNFPYYEYFKPLSKPTLYKKKQGKKFVGPPGTWMFDLMYFSDYNTKKYRKQAIYLLGININTRYAVCRRVRGKKVSDLIPAFEDLLQHELNGKIRLLIFDGEKAISSKEFETYCKEHNINVRITYPGIHTQTAPIDRLCRTIRDYFTKFYMHHHKPINITYRFTDPWLKNNIYKHKIMEQAINIRKMFNGEDRYKIAPIPSEFVSYYDKLKDDDVYAIKDSAQEFQYKQTPSRYEKDGDYVSDELYNIVSYYNNRKHNGLVRLLKDASFLFQRSLNCSVDDITPTFVNESPYLESMIIQYCRYYNTEIVEQGDIYNIGDKVRVYDCFTSDRGNLARNNTELLIGDWEIVSKDGEIYGVFNNSTNQLLHVSKYMLRSLNAASN